MRIIFISYVLLLSFFYSQTAICKTIYAGNNCIYANLQSASGIAEPGDLIIVKNGTYFNRENLFNINGTKLNPIIIQAEDEGKVIYNGQSEAWHLSSCSNICIIGFIFEEQSGNGVNIDDSGNNYGSSYNITIKNCTFRDMISSGNNDLLKLSGLDHFKIENCEFLNGASGGSGIDMVGCHYGYIVDNKFQNLGSSGIQVKGGSQNITIKNNYFNNAGNRALNIGGSTGLEYFRPLDAKFEAADILVATNVFIGSWSPVAFVGSTRIRVINNTIFKPENWVFRILQETVDDSRFVKCGQNEFSNNIIYFGDNLSRIVNIGPNTAPESFIFQTNLWYNYQNNNFSDPNLPAPEINSIIQKDPQFQNIVTENFDLLTSSPVIEKGTNYSDIISDFKERYYNKTPSIGAFEPTGTLSDFSGSVGDTWYYKIDVGYLQYTLNEKSIIENKETSNFSIYLNIGDLIDESNCIMHTSNKTTLIKKDDDGWYTSDFTYNFNLLKGDTLYNLNSYDEPYFIIDSIRYKYLANKLRKVQYLTSYNNVTNEPLAIKKHIFIEGIYSLLSNITPLGKYDSSYLRCFIFNDSSGIEQTVKFSEEYCALVIGKTLNNDKKPPELYPSIADDLITIIVNDYEIKEIAISNLSSQILRTIKVNFLPSYHINVDNLQPGIYFINFISRNIIKPKKFLIIR